MNGGDMAQVRAIMEKQEREKVFAAFAICC